MPAKPKADRPPANRRPLATPEELSEYLKIPVDTLKDWRYRGEGPKWNRVGRHPRYKWDDIDAWYDAQPKKPESRATSEQGVA